MTKTIKSKALISAIFVALLCVLLSVAVALPASAEELTPIALEGSDAEVDNVSYDTNNCIQDQYPVEVPTLIPTVSGSCGTNATWEYYEGTGELKILGSGSMSNYYSTNTPWYSYRSNIKNITISEGIISIGEWSFSNCSSLTSIEVPSSVTSIGDYAFHLCCKLIEIYNLSELDISCGSEFNGSVGEFAKVIHTSKDEESIIENIDGYQVAYFDDTYYLLGYIGEETDLILPTTFNYKGEVIDQYGIYVYAFAERGDIKSIEISPAVTRIDVYAFSDCDGLTEMTIPATVESIDNFAFSGCSSLETIAVEEGNAVYHSKDNCIINTSKKELIAGCQNSIIPEDGSVTVIGNGAFDHCSTLVSIEIPSTIVRIGRLAFQWCTALTDIKIPSSVTRIEAHSFNGCSELIQKESGISYVDK